MNKPEPAALPSSTPSQRSLFSRFTGNAVTAMGWLGLATLIVGSIFLLGNISYAIYKFADTKYALLGRGANEATAQFLAWVVVITACSISFIPILRIVFWRPKRTDFALALATPLITFAISLIPANFGPDGRPLQFCATRPNGEQFCLDHKGVDPLTGITLEAVTSGSAIEQLRRKDNLLPQPVATAPEHTHFFDSLNGKPKVWYSRRDDGCFDLFNQSGVHPTTGEPLLEVNRDIVKQVFACHVRQKEAQQRVQATQAAARPVAAVVSPYFESAAISGGANWTVVAMRGDPGAVQSVVPALTPPVSISTFKPAFFSEGVFGKAILGDAAALQRMSLPDTVARVVLIEAGHPTFTRHGDQEGLVRANQVVRVASIEPRSGRVITTVELRAEGAGFSNGKALQRLAEDLEKKARETLRH